MHRLEEAGRQSWTMIDCLDLGRRTVLQDGLSPRQFLERQLAAIIVKFLGTVKAVLAALILQAWVTC
jgi:hypothetical protein